MTIPRNSIKTPIPVLILSTLCWLLLTAAKPMPEVGVTTNEAPWLTEEQFATDLTLHATRAQTVVLELESTGQGKSAIRKNSTRFLVEKAQNFSFCIPADEPHILRIKLQLSHGGRTLINSRGNKSCKAVMLEPGSYALDVFHDGRSVGPAGKRAFVHRPARQRYGVGTDPQNTLQESLVYPNFFALTAGKDMSGAPLYVLGGPSEGMSAVSDLGLLDAGIWSFTSAIGQIGPQWSRTLATWTPPNEWNKALPATFYVIVDNVELTYPQDFVFIDNDCEPETNNPNKTINCTVGFDISDKGDGQFTMPLSVADGWDSNPLVFGEALTPSQINLVIGKFITANSDWVVFDFVFIGYPDPTAMPALQKGEYALYAECNFAGTAFVFNEDTDLTQFGQLTNKETKPPSEIRSIKLGPSTFLEVFKDGQNVENVGGNVDCASTPIEADQVTVFADALDFIAATKSCINCDLTGLDFSNQNFSEVNFSGAILYNANLTGTIFSTSNLTHADISQPPGSAQLSMADFGGATLDCTSFSSADITQASFDGVVVKQDRSCNKTLTTLDLSLAKLNFDTFEVTDWRYFDLTSSTVNDVPPVLSTAALPLDLAGANLSFVTWLKGKQLDNVNLGCYAMQSGQTTVCPTANGTKACTNLQNTALNSTSLKQACLSNASLEGALLNESNLDGANLSGAQLIALTNGDAATLAGAFMRGADLSGANLTGVDASHVNFYTGLTGTANAQGIQAAGASFANAYLAGADFSGTGANLQGTDWSGAVLVGAKFEQSDLSEDAGARKSTSFAQAFMHGADFHNQQVETTNGANFSNSYWDLSNAETLNFLLPVQNLSFTGYWRQGTCGNNPNQICTASTDCGTGDSCNFVNQSGVCVVNDISTMTSCTNDSECGGGVCLAQPECVEAMYNQSNAATPPTDNSNKCPNTNQGGCDGSWGQPQIPISEANPPVAVAPAFPVAPGDALQCTSADFTWQLGD